MGISRRDLENWYNQGVQDKKTHMIVVCDTFDWEDFPVYVKKDQNFYSVYDQYSGGKNMARIMEVYDLNANKQDQMDEHRANNLPSRTKS